MPAAAASAPGKIILFGEHAVVYDRPALAIPVHQVHVTARVSANPRAESGRVWVDAPEIKLHRSLADLPADNPLRLAVNGVQQALNAARIPAVRIQINSTIPVAAGLGSGAAVSVALIRALSTFLGHPLPDEEVNRIAYTVEQRLHGTPSGIDNTVITYARPVYYQRSQGFQTLNVGKEQTFVIADTGIKSPTSKAVGDVRAAWQQEPQRYEALFNRVSDIVARAKEALEQGQDGVLGPLMDENHSLLCQMGVSSVELDHLVDAARAAGAQGAKLSGGGRGGNMIALVKPEQSEAVAQALVEAGAVRTIITHLQSSR